MFHLVQLFLRLSGFLVFLFLEIICFTMVVKHNETQQDIYLNSINRGSLFFQKKVAAFRHYFSLSDENYRLARANARLLEKLYTPPQDTLLADTALAGDGRPQYTFLVARVINNTTNRHHNYITLDKGSKAGVMPHSGVVTERGVVGIVRGASEHYSVAMSVLHRQMRISARVKGTRFPGSLVWDEDQLNGRTFTLLEIPKHADISVGDTVVTSGFSAIFPKGIMLGIIENIEIKPGKHDYNIRVVSDVDMANIDYVYIIKNLFAEEQRELELSITRQDQ